MDEDRESIEPAVHRAARYRPEIDGLRAVAVLAVMAFHARLRGAGGGFVGVDIFLVLSGYLITQVILRDSDTGGFSLAGFYERRVRRIMPALLAMLAVTGGLGWMLLPIDFAAFGDSLTAIALFMSNLLFWQRDGYFALTTDAAPLLHTWSLAVEEQFYLVFPALLLLARRGGPGTTRLVLAAAALASFAYSVWAAANRPEAAFYSPLSRAWEFVVGALLAQGLFPTPKRRLAGDLIAAMGLGLIGYAVVRFSAVSPFPGYAALVPVLGSALVLLGTAAPASRAADALAARPLVAIGLISYSLYLWHWPLMVFGGYYAAHGGGPIRIVMALASFPIAWLSWRYIERPFRRPRQLLSRPALLTGAAAASAGLALYGVAIHVADGFPARFDPVVQRLSERGPAPDYGCASRPVARLGADPRCVIGGGGPRPRFMLWGDSHAAVYFPALDALARRYGVAGYDAARVGCPPLITIPPRPDRPDRWMFDAARRAQCGAHNAQVLGFLAEHRPAAVLLAAEWSLYVDPAAAPGSDAGFEAGVRRLQALGIRVYVAQDVPSAPLAEPRALAKAHLRGDLREVEPARAAYLGRDAAFRAITARLARQGMIEVIEPAARLCGPTRCRVTDRDYPLYFDSNHLDRRGALFVAPTFEPMMRALSRR